MADENTPFSVSELQATPEYQAAGPAERARAINANQDQWRQHLRDDFGPVETGDYWQSLNDVERVHERARTSEITSAVGSALRDGKVSEDQVKGYFANPKSFAETDQEAATFLETMAPPEALRGPYIKTTQPIQGADGRTVGTMWVRGNDKGTEVAYRFDDNEDGVLPKSDGTGQLMRVRKDGTPAKDRYGVWTNNDSRDKILTDQKDRLAKAEFNREYNSGDGAPFTGDLLKANEAAMNEAGERLTAYSDPQTGAVANAMDRFVDHAKKNLSDQIPEGGIIARLGGEMLKGIGNTGAVLSHPGFLWGNREDGEAVREGMALVDTIEGRRQGGFEGGFKNDVINSSLRELPNLALTMGTGMAVSGVRLGVTAALEEAAVSQAAGVAAKSVLARALTVLPKSTVANLLEGSLGKAVGTNAIEGHAMKQVADRVTASLVSLPTTTRAGYENWVSTVDKADALRKEGKTEEADRIEENATLNAWAGIAIENVSENIWLNEMLVTRTGHPLKDVATSVLAKKMGATGLQAVKDRIISAAKATLKAAPQGAVEEAVAGIAGRAWMNNFAAQNQDLFEGLGTEMTVGALLEGMAGAAHGLAENGKPELLNELQSRALRGDPQAAKFAEDVINSSRPDQVPIDPVEVAKSIPVEDKQDVNTVDDFVTFTNDSGQEEVIANNNKILKDDSGFSLADANFADRKFPTRKEAEDFAAVRYQGQFQEKLAASMAAKGSDPDEIAATSGLIDKMFDTAARGAGVRKDVIYKRLQLEDAATETAAPDALNQEGFMMTRAEFAAMDQPAPPVKKERDILYVGDVEVIRNPSPSDYASMERDVRKKFGPKERGGDPDLRFTQDDQGNRWIWKAHEGMHSSIEPQLSKLEGVSVNQNAKFDPPNHRQLVGDAIRRGDFIPDKVLDEYPEYKKFYKGPIGQSAENAQKLRGSYQNIEDGAKGLIKIFANGDPSTYLHEAFHALQKLNVSGVSLLDHAMGAESANFWNWATNNGAVARDSVDALERGARGLEAYLREGVAPAPELTSTFEKIAKLLRSIYQTVKDLGVNLTDDARKAFDSLFANEGEGLPNVPTDAAPTQSPGLTPQQIAAASSLERFNAAKARLSQNRTNDGAPLGQSAPVAKDRAPDLLEVAGYYLTTQALDTKDQFIAAVSRDEVLGRLDANQLGWLYDRAGIIKGSAESSADAAYLGDLAAEMKAVFDAAGTIDAEYIQAVNAEAARVVRAEGIRSGFTKQAAAMAETLEKAKTMKSSAAAIARAESLIERMAYGRMVAASKSLKVALNAYTKGSRTGRDQVVNILRAAETLFNDSLTEDSGIDDDIKSVARDVMRKIRMVAEGGKMTADELVPQIAAAMSRVAGAAGRAAKRSAQKQIQAARNARREAINNKRDMIGKIKEAIRKSKVRLTNTEVRSILGVISKSDTANEVIQRGNRIAQILGKAYLRGEYSKARGLHAGVKTRLKNGIYGDATDTVMRPFADIDPADVPVQLLAPYIAHLEALTDGTKAVAFGDYQESLLSMTAAVQQYLVDEAAAEPDIEEADGGRGTGTAQSIRADAEEALENFLRDLDPGSIRPEARREAHSIKWLLRNPAIMQDWSTGDIVALMKSLKNAQHGVIDVFFGKAAMRAMVAQIEGPFRTLFDIATRKELGIRAVDMFEGLTPEQERRMKMDAMRGWHRAASQVAGALVDSKRPDLLGKGYSGRLDSAGQHFMGDFLGVGDMLDLWLHHDLYRGAIAANKMASQALSPFTKSYQSLEKAGALLPRVEALADVKNGAMDIPWTRQHVRRQQVAGKMVMAYMLQREHENNGNTGSWILEENNRIQGDARVGRSQLNERPQDTENKVRVINLIGAATKADFSAAGIYGALSDSQKQIIRDYDAMKKDTASRIFYRSLLTRGQLLPMFKDHVHHKSLEKRGDLESNQNSWGSAIAPAPLTNASDKNKDSVSRPPASFERAPGVRNVSWDLYDVVTEEITDSFLDFEVTPTLAAAGTAMRNIEFASPSETTKGIVRAVMQAEAGHAAVMAMHSNSEGRIATSYSSWLKNWITNKAITSPLRAADEFAASAIRWGIQDPMKLKVGIDTYAKNAETRKKWDELFFKLGVTAAVRRSNFSPEGVESGINQASSGEIESAMRTPFKWGRESFGVGGGEKPTNPGTLGWITSNKFAQKTGEWGRWLNSFGDTALSIPMAVGHFLKEYHTLTGKAFDINAAGNDDPGVLKVVAVSTDRFVDQNIAPSHSAKNALKVQGGVDGKTQSGMIRFLLYGLGTYSRTVMHQSMAQLGILLGRGAGVRERAAAFQTLTAMTISATAYNVLAQGMVRALWALGGGDEEEKEMAAFFADLDEPEYWMRQLGAGFFGNLIGGRGLFARIALGSGVEGAWKAARTHLWGDYDKYRDNMMNAIPAQNIMSGEDLKFEDGYRMTSGLFGVVANTGATLYKDVEYLMNDAAPAKGKAGAAIDIGMTLLHGLLQFPGVRDLDKINKAQTANAERAAKFKERYGKDFAKEKGERESAVKRFVTTGNGEKWDEYLNTLSPDQKKSAEATHKREAAVMSARVLEPEEWRRLAAITDGAVKAAEYERLYKKAPDKIAFQVERDVLDKAGSNVWTRDPQSEFRKELRARGIP